MNIYIAAPFGEYLRANKIAKHIAERGHTVVSRWHTYAEKFGGQDSPVASEMCKGLAMCIEDMREAHEFIALLDQGTPRATLCEIGIARWLGKRVHWLGSLNLYSYPHEDLGMVVRYLSEADLLEMVDEWMWGEKP